MIAVRVGARDRDHLASVDGTEQCLHMIGQIRAWINDREFLGADQVRLSAVISEGRRVARKHSGDPRLERFKQFVRGIHGTALPWSLPDA
jgi:hypothetical protein